MRQEYPNSVFNFTGHSLGGYLAVHNAAENKSQATVFNAPDASNTMNKDQIDFVLNNQHPSHSLSYKRLSLP